MTLGTLFLLIGAGCSDPTMVTPPVEQPAPVVVPPTIAETQPIQEQNSVTEMTLTGEALGKNMVKFQWTLPNGMNDPASFRLVRGPKENPVSPGNYFFQVLGNKREMTWISLPTGKQNFRICTFIDNKCDVYSNNIEVDVK